ncbi:MAG TPA: aminoacyl-tRNA hydrolase [Thermoleophilaceae bacterium]|nr:aminoacyl-tRNA hydrolase [Thermoleophilaceae bacterium]
MSLFRRGRSDGGRVDWLVVGLGNPGDRYARTRHNVGFEVAALAAERWGLPRAKKRYAGLYTDGRTGPGGPRVGVLLPQTFMNESGSAASPARGALGVELDHVVAVHDEIDLPFGRIEVRLGGGLAGHNGLKSLKRGLGSADFRRVRVGVGRPDSTDPEIVSAHVLGRFSESTDEVRALIERAVDELDRLVTSGI